MNIFPNRVFFSAAFPSIPKSVSDIWIILSCYLKQNRSLPSRFEVSQLAGHDEPLESEHYLQLNSEEITQLIVKRKLFGFWVNSGSFERCTSMDFRLLNAKNLGYQSTLTCLIGNKAKAPDDWSSFIEQIAATSPSIGAWQWKSHYCSWQDTSVLTEGYERLFGEIPPGFRITHEPSIDGIGKGRTLMDKSLNPGRSKQLIPTICFYPTAEMWLGPHFWQYAKCTKEEALAADFWLETRDTPHFAYFKCWPTAFTRPDGEQGRMQQRLWKLFFNEDCEWPPGSGSICDEPMYGPPELMPEVDPRASQ